MAKQPKFGEHSGSTVGMLERNAGTTPDTQPEPEPGKASGKARSVMPGVDSTLSPTKGAPKAARPSGKSGERAEGAPKE
jgi:hypothetical protein